jgi:hypothetical protein
MAYPGIRAEEAFGTLDEVLFHRGDSRERFAQMKSCRNPLYKRADLLFSLAGQALDVVTATITGTL